MGFWLDEKSKMNKDFRNTDVSRAFVGRWINLNQLRVAFDAGRALRTLIGQFCVAGPIGGIFRDARTWRCFDLNSYVIRMYVIMGCPSLWPGRI